MSGFLTTNPKKFILSHIFESLKTLDFKTAACNMLLYQTWCPQKHSACIIVGLKNNIPQTQEKKNKTTENNLNHAVPPLGSS